MEVYQHGISFRNPRPEPIPYQDNVPSYIAYAQPATGPKGRFGRRKTAWAATGRAYVPRGGFEMIKDTPQVDGLGSWLSRTVGRVNPGRPELFRRELPKRETPISSIAATRLRLGGANAMIRRTAILAASRPKRPTDSGFIQRMFRKDRALRGLGLSGISSTPTFGELALGEAQAPTATSGTAVRSSFTGFLQNVLTTGADIYKTQQETKLQQLKAQVQAGEAAMIESLRRAGTSNLPMILGVGGAAVLAATLLLKKKRG